MDKRTFLKSLAMLAAAPALGDGLFAAQATPVVDEDWTLNVSVLESCSCPVFCQCFFTGKPPASHEAHGGMQHVCRFNQAYQVNTGHVGPVRLDGARFWLVGDAGDDFDKPKLDWAVLTFDSRLTPERRTALLGAIQHLRWYRPERWKSFAIGPSAPIEWAADNKGAHATLGGSIAEVKLTTLHDLNTSPVTISNMGYFGYPRNNGFVLMPSDLIAYRQGARAFEYKGTNGLLTTVEMNAHDFAKRGTEAPAARK